MGRKSLQPSTCFHHPLSDRVTFDKCASIPRLLRRGSTTVVGRTKPDANPTPNTHKDVRWRDERFPNCLFRWWETIEAGHCVPPIDPVGS